jgi:hypothetical protein
VRTRIRELDTEKSETTAETLRAESPTAELTADAIFSLSNEDTFDTLAKVNCCETLPNAGGGGGGVGEGGSGGGSGGGDDTRVIVGVATATVISAVMFLLESSPTR